MNPLIEEGVVYVPMVAEDGKGMIGDGYVPLLSLPKEEQEKWEKEVALLKDEKE